MPDAPDAPIERDATAPPQPDSGQTPEAEEWIHLPALISDEFGVSSSDARMQIMMGIVTVDGVELEGDKLNLLRDEVVGKTVEVKGDTRTFRVQIQQ